MSSDPPSVTDSLRLAPSRSRVPVGAARSIVTGLARRQIRDRFRIVDGDRSWEFGEWRAGDPEVRVLDERAWPMVLTGGSAGLGEAYLRGWWETAELTESLRILLRTLDRSRGARSSLQRIAAPLTEPVRRRRRSNPARDRRNIVAHYDIGNEFFEILLDPTMTYSSGLFDRADMTMEEASIAKIDRLCRELRLEPGMRLVEIGSGWGAFAIRAAVDFGVHVTTTTISNEQFDHVSARVAALGLHDRIEVRHDDYRDLTGRFDRVVSIEMIEAVDWRDHDTFFRVCADLLEPDGLFGLQAITIDDDRYERAKHTEDFIKAFIFPGGCLPSVRAIERSMDRSTDLRVVADFRFGPSYAETLRRWRGNLIANATALTDLDLDDAFVRMWEFYLCYCEAGFDEGSIDVRQMVFEHRR